MFALALLTLAGAVGVVSANRFAFTEQHFRVVWPAGERMLIEELSGSIRVRCPVTLEGSFHSRTISKVVGALIGYITVARIGFFSECEATGVTAVAFLPETLPWHVQYVSFTGTLPSINTVDIKIIRFSVQLSTNLAGICLYESTAARPLFMSFVLNVEGKITGLHPNEVVGFPKHNGGGFCPEPIFVTRTGTSVTVPGMATPITVTLVQ